MKVGKPDAQMPMQPREQSLVERLRERLGSNDRNGEGQGGPERRLAIAVAVLIAAGPLLTIAGANVLAAREHAATARLEADLAPRIATARSAESARRELSAVLQRRTLAQSLEALGRVLPPDATLVRLERTAGGALEIDIASADPDRLRMALRRAPEFSQIRNVGQRQADAEMIVSFLGGAE